MSARDYTTANQWRQAANVLREHAALFDQRAEEAERVAGHPVCGVVSASGPHGEPLGCGFPFGHDGAHAWASLPTLWQPQLCNFHGSEPYAYCDLPNSHPGPHYFAAPRSAASVGYGRPDEH